MSKLVSCFSKLTVKYVSATFNLIQLSLDLLIESP